MVKSRGQSAAFMARIRKLRGKKSVQTSTKSQRRYKMAKRKARRGGKRKNSGAMSGILATSVGVGGYILFESLVEPKLLAMANISNPLLVNVGELALGMYLSRKSGVLGSVGKAAIVINLYQILHPYLSTIGTGTNSSPSSIFS